MIYHRVTFDSINFHVPKLAHSGSMGLTCISGKHIRACVSLNALRRKSGMV